MSRAHVADMRMPPWRKAKHAFRSVRQDAGALRDVLILKADMNTRLAVA